MKTRRHTFRGDPDDFDRWERAAKLLRLDEFGDFVRRALDDLADHVEKTYDTDGPAITRGSGVVAKRAGAGSQARPLSKKQQASGRRE